MYPTPKTYGKVLSAVAANAAAGLRTYAFDVRMMSKLSILVDFTKNAGTAIVITPSVSIDAGAHYAPMPSVAITAGAGTVSPRVDTAAMAGSGQAAFDFDLHAYDDVKILVAITGGNGSDLFDLYGKAQP